MNIPNLSPAELAGLTPDEVINRFGGEDRAKELLRWCRYNSVAPTEARTDYLKFVRYMHPHPDHFQDADQSSYDVQPHHRLLADLLTEVVEGKCQRVAISMPPQSGKSTIGTRMFLPYHAGKFPRKHLLMGAYNQDFAEEFGDEVRNVIQSPEYQRVFPRLKLRQGSKAKDHMTTEEGGKLSFIGRDGSGTGRPADGFLLDDLIKNPKEAESRTHRNDVWNFFTRVANTRIHARSWIVIIMTRWSDDDLIARLTDPRNPYYRASVAKQWTVINIPAIMDDRAIAEALGKKVGDALWPERFPLELLATAREMDPYGFSALHMGRPTPPEGAFYKESDIYTYDTPGQFPKGARMYLTGDLAVSVELTADKTAVGAWGLDQDDVLWLHPNLYWERRSSDESVDEIIEMGTFHKVMEGFFEKGQLDKAVGPFLEKRMAEKKAYFTLTRLPVTGNKGAKSLSMRGRMRQGKVRFPSFSPWWPAAKEQLLKFTGSGDDKEDDFCDMCALIGQALDDTVPAGKPGNVHQFPKVGTLAWVKYQSEKERKWEKRRMRRGM